jgi:hypothetical protein
MIHTRVNVGRRLGVVSLSLATAAQAVMLAAMPGCTDKKPPAKESMHRAPEAPSAASRTQRQMSALQSSVDALAESAKALPGRTESAQRQLMAKVFTDLQQVLPLLAPDARTGAFRQQLAIIQSSKDKLASGSARGLDEPTINTGLRAAANALTRMAVELDLPNSAALIKPVEDQVNALDEAAGPLHRLTVADAVAAQTNLVKALAVVVTQRMDLALQLDEASSGASKETSKPEVTSAPATRPAKATVTPGAAEGTSTSTESASAPSSAATSAPLPTTQLIPTTVPSEPLPPPANQPTPSAATQTVTPAPGTDREMNKQ